MKNRTPISDYSKGSRGLSVLLRVSGICTGTTISPRTTLRQCPDRYTIRAGRNLPDKEFRYLRTVIVTADIHRGFGSQLPSTEVEMTDSLDLSALVTCHTLYILLSSSQSAVFLLNSRLGLFVATSSSSASKSLHHNEAPLLPKLRGYFAEFLNVVYLAHLRLLALPTCVGLRYGHPIINV